MSKYWNLKQIETIMLTSKNVIFCGSLFANYETTIGFMASKQVRGWPRILILISGWFCTQNETTLINNCHSSSRKMWLCANDTKCKHLICFEKYFFLISTTSISLLQNRAPFGWDLIEELQLHGIACEWFEHFRQKRRTPSWRGDSTEFLAPRMGSGSD